MALKEHGVFTENYAKFCSTLTDIENLLQYFVQEKIIKPEDQDDIKISAKTQDKVKNLLKHIAGPLQAGDSKGFYTMLDIMENHGVQATKDLAESLKTILSTDSNKPPEVSKQKSGPAIVHKPANRLSAQFSSLVRTVENFLDKSSKNLETCKRICLDLTISDNSDVLLFNDEQLKKFKECTSFRELFELLRQHWSWKEYCILEHIITESESKEAKDELEKYEKMMSSYCALQIIADNFSPNELPNEYIKMTIIIEKPYKEFTLQNFTELRDFIFKQMDVKPYIAHPFIKFLFSSLHLEWYVLQQAVPHMIKMSYENIERLKEHFIVQIKIGEETILDDYIVNKVKNDGECGYTFEFIESVPCELICKLCKLPCKNLQTSLCCKSALCEIHTETIPVHSECPLCHNDKLEIFSDSESDKKIQSLFVYCPNRDAGCRWVGKLSQVTLHCDDDTGCPFQKLKCPSKCGKLLQRQNIAEHLTTECPCYCQYCKATANEVIIENQHKENCNKYSLQCPNNCGMKVLHENIHEHCRLCPLEEIQCEYYSLGCRDIILRKDKEEHDKNNLINHLNLIKHKISGKNSMTTYWGDVYYAFLLIVLIAVLSQLYYMKLTYEDLEDLSLLRAEYDDLKTNLAHVKVQNEKLQKDVHTKTLTKQYIDDSVRDLKDEISYIDDDVDSIKQENNNFQKHLNNLQNDIIALELKLIAYLEIVNTTMLMELLNQFKTTEMNAMDILNRTNETNARIMEYMSIINNAYQNLSEIVKKDLDKYEESIQNNSAEYKKIIEKHYGTMMSTNWRLYLTMVHLVALHGDKVMPVVLAMRDYSWYAMTNVQWVSTPFFDTENGNYMDLLVKAIAFNISVTLRLLTRVQYMQEGTFTIEMMNQYNDTDHSVGKIPYSEDPTTTSVSQVKPTVIGNVGYSIFTGQENVVYLRNDVVYFKVSFVNSN